MYTNQELKISLPFMVAGIDTGRDEVVPSLDEMLQMAKEISNVPQQLTSSKSRLNQRLKALDDLVNTISNSWVLALQDIVDNTGYFHGYHSIHEALFAIDIKDDASKRSSIMDESHDEELYKAHQDHNCDSVGYDGHLVKDYGACVSALMSCTILESVTNVGNLLWVV
jgi:hypothetical protein